MKTTVIYHSADFDGIFCREIARKFLPDAELIGWNHGDAKLTFPSTGRVYVLDLSPECFETGSIISEHLVWIDHHKSAIEKYPSSWPGYRIDGVAACRLAWFWFVAWSRFKNQTSLDPDEVWFQKHYPFATKQHFADRKLEEPLAVRLAGEYDIWDKRDPRADLFQHGLRSQELTPLDWRMLLSNEIPESLVGTGMEETNSTLQCAHLLQAGRAIQYSSERQNESIIKTAGFDFEFEGLKFLACNHARFNSHLFTAGIRPDHDALFGFAYDGKQWKVSLYAIPGKDIDLSLIAVKHGGGGHRGACGFRMAKLPF